MQVDHKNKHVIFKVAVRGSGADGFLNEVARTMGVGKVPDSQPDGEMLMLPLTLGAPVSGWQVEVQLHATMSRFSGPRMLVVRSSDAVLELLEGTTETDRTARVQALSNDLEVFGYALAHFPCFAVCSEAVRELERVDPSEGPMGAIKVVTKRLLEQGKRVWNRAPP